MRLVGRVAPRAPFWSGNERRARSDAPYLLKQMRQCICDLPYPEKAEIEANGEPTGSNRGGRGSGNDGRSGGFGLGICFCFHRQSSVTQ